MGHRPCNGTRPRVPQAVGLRTRRRTDLGQDEPAAADNPHRSDRPLAEPRQGALPGGHEGQPAEPEPRPGLRRHRGGSARHLAQTGRNLRHHRAAQPGHAEDRAVWKAAQRAAELDHARQSVGRHPVGGSGAD
uniref:(northern house mosquito) hypothetical protein n=1 Tax=Culex pipiens TaxID=7175 RepID=A0A8D8PB46_CULPI